MKIGVICEGPTDYPAFVHFLGSVLREAGKAPSFVSLFPQMDKTRPEGGWANVLLWLRNNPANLRVQRYFSGGLFGGALSAERLDAIVIQIDSDNLDSSSFAKFVLSEYQHELKEVNTAQERGAEVMAVLSLAAQLDALTEADRNRHVIAPAVESTETWCVAAFHGRPANFEELRGLQLVNAFMTALESSEGRTPATAYSNIDKSLTRRNRFCEKHAGGASRVVSSCGHFAQTTTKIIGLS